MYSSPQVNLYTADLPRSWAFYERLGFTEVFRTPPDGEPDHVELVLDGFRIGIARASAATRDHGLDPDLAARGRGMEIVLWTDDADRDFAALVATGASPLSEPHDWLDHLRVAWVADPDGNPIELVQHRG